MNLKQLIKFGLENSSNPVIKNPILRDALEPRSMDQALLQDDLVPGPLRDEMLKDFDPSQETYEEYLQRINLERPFNMAEGGQLVAPSVDGLRPGYGGKQNISYNTENKIVKEYNKYLANEIKSGDLSKSLGFKSWLRENKTPAVFQKTYNAHSKNQLNVKPSKLTDAKVGLIKTMVDRANAQGKFVEKKQILKLIGRDTIPGLAKKNVYVDKVIEEINKLDTQEMKVHKAFNKLINNELVFVTDPDFYQKFPTAKSTEPGSMTRMLMAESGLGDTTVRKYRSTFKKPGSNVPYFNTKKGKQQLDIIKHMNLKMGKVGEEVFDGFSFNDLMEYGANSKKGKMYFKTAIGSDFYKDPNNVVRDFAVKNFDNNAKWGNESKIQFYKKGSNTPIKWQPGKKITADFDFTYEGKRYGNKDLAKEYLKWTRGENTPFKEVYDNHRAYVDFLKRPAVVDGQKTTIGKLFKDAGHMGMAIDHSTLGGVGEEPFKNLRLLSSRANSDLGTILQYYNKSPKIQKLLANEFTKHLPVNENYIDALAKNEIKIAKDMLKHGNSTIPMTYNQAAKNILTNKNIKNFSPNELLTVSKSAFGPEFGYKKFKGVQPEVFKGVETRNQLFKLIKSLCPKGKASGGRIGFAEGPPTVACGRKALDKGLATGKWESPEKAKLAKKILQTAGKSGLAGKIGSRIAAELFGPFALAAIPVFELGVAGYDTVTAGTPFKEAVNKTFLHYGFGDEWKADPEKLKRKDILKMSSGPEKEMLVRLFGNIEGLNRLSNLYEKQYNLEQDKDLYEAVDIAGYGDAGVSVAGIDKQIKDVENEIQRSGGEEALSDLSQAATDPAAIGLYESKQGERTAINKAGSLWGSMPNPYYTSPNSAYTGEVRPERIEAMQARGPSYGMWSPAGDNYEKLSPEYIKFLNEYYTSAGIIPEGGDVSEYGFEDSGKTILEEEQMANKWKQLMRQPGMLGTQYNADGGRAGYMGGGITGIRRPHAIPPESGPNPQGLPSMLNRVKRI